MATRTLDRSERQHYFDQISRHLADKQAMIEVAGLGLGAQVAHDWTVLRGIAYDPRADALQVVTDDLDHMIAHPREVYVDDSLNGLQSVEVVDAEGNRQMIRLRDPLRLSDDSAGHA